MWRRSIVYRDFRQIAIEPLRVTGAERAGRAVSLHYGRVWLKGRELRNDSIFVETNLA
jgi:hypothetical protein